MIQTFYIIAALAFAMFVVCVGLAVIIVCLERRLEQLLDKISDLKKQIKAETPKRSLRLANNEKTKPSDNKVQHDDGPTSLWDSINHPK